MNLKAREVLSDCERAVATFDGTLQGPTWRAEWVGLVALLRAVGHVLHKVDRNSSPAAAGVVEREWQRLQSTKPEPSIFFEFIEKERNSVLKAYEFAPGVNVTVRPGSAWLNIGTGESGSSPGGPTTYEAFIRSGPFKGRDPVGLCREAIEFWCDHLDRVEHAILEASQEKL